MRLRSQQRALPPVQRFEEAESQGSLRPIKDNSAVGFDVDRDGVDPFFAVVSDLSATQKDSFR